jgi:hypothetical protein
MLWRVKQVRSSNDAPSCDTNLFVELSVSDEHHIQPAFRGMDVMLV